VVLVLVPLLRRARSPLSAERGRGVSSAGIVVFAPLAVVLAVVAVAFAMLE